MTKTASQKIELRNISTFRGADYNPRKVDQSRLNQVKNSLSKLGFLLPIYVTEDGTLLSGHQRTSAAIALGYTQLPVVTLDISEDKHKGLNLVFNKATNDLDTYQDTAKSRFTEYVERADEVAIDLPAIPPDTSYPCLEVQTRPLKEIMEMCKGQVPSSSLRQAGNDMIKLGVYMPIVICDGQVVNGIGRVFGYYDCGFKAIPVVEIPVEKKDYANLALNFLAMDFDIQKNFENELRYNAFRRKSVQQGIVGLSRTHSYWVYGRIVSNKHRSVNKLAGAENEDLKLLPTYSRENYLKFKKVFGDYYFDMGAGTCHDAQLLQEAGLNCVPFEPYYSPEGTSTPSREASHALNSAFLDALENCPPDKPSSIVSSFVLNSIPHHKDRMAYLVILAAMCKLKTKVYVGTQSTKLLKYGNVDHQLRMNSNEPNMTLGNNSKFFKAQKYYTVQELEKMFKTFFLSVEIKQAEQQLFVKASKPRRMNPKLLREALLLEFELPFSDGKTLGLGQRALEVFSKHTGMDLN